MDTRSGVFASARIIALLTMASRVLGVVREAVLGYFFSTSELLSAFRIAFMVPNLARRLFGEGALSSSMIPVLTDSLRARGEEPSRRFVGRLLIVLTIVLVLSVLAVELIVWVWRAIHDDPALWLVAVMMPYMAPICLTAVIGGVLNVRKSFAVPAGVPILLNVILIAAAGIGARGLGLKDEALMRMLAWGVVAGGIVQLAISYAGLLAIRFAPIFSASDDPDTGSSARDGTNAEIGTIRSNHSHEGWLRRSWNDPYVRKVCTLLLPMTLGLSAMQVNSLADYLIAYFFIKADGERVGPAVLGYAQYLYQLPLGVFGISLATAIFPTLSERAAAGDHKGMAEILARGIRVTQVTALPAAVGLMFIANPLTAVLFERGRFNADDTARVATTLVFYCLGLVFYFTQHLLVRAFYSLQDSRTPVRVAGWMVAVNFVMNLILVFPLQERGLALSTSVCAGIQVVCLARRLSRRMPGLAWGEILCGLLRLVAAAGVMSLALTVIVSPTMLGAYIGESPYVRLPVMVAAGVVTYVLAAKLLHAPELNWAMEQRQRSEPQP